MGALTTSSRGPTRVVRLTPAGRAAVTSLLVDGPVAIELVDQHFHPARPPALCDTRPRQIRYGRWGEPQRGEEVVVAALDHERVEIHCHGGAAAVAAIVRELETSGAEEVPWNEALAPLATTTGDPIRSAAGEALARTTTRRTAELLLAQYHGALRAELEQVLQLMADEDGGNDDGAKDGSAHEGGEAAATRLDTLLADAPLGLHLTEAWRVVLAGPPNAGKSTLINALVGYDRSIAHAEPGTTRDVVRAAAAIDGWPIELADTAGLRTAGDSVEAEGVARAEALLREADLVVVVFDLAEPWGDEQAALLRSWPEAIVVHNKSDLVDALLDPRPAGLRLSAQTGEGLDALRQQLVDRLVPTTVAANQPLLFTRQQIRSVSAARESLPQDPAKATRHLRVLMSTPQSPDRI
ncbi:MAG: GTP-binding protein [Planctomycetota bacterium]|nr:MAG: GTP-binding protein [Planctomycetota bacterium]